MPTLFIPHGVAPFLSAIEVATGVRARMLGANAMPTFPNKMINAVDVSPNGQYLAFVTQIGPYPTVYDTSTWAQVALSTVSSGTGVDCRFSPNGAYLAVTYTASPYLRVYDTSTWTAVTLSSGLPNEPIGVVGWSPNSAMLAVTNTTTSPYVTIYNTSDWSKVSFTAGGTSQCAAFSPDGARLFLGTPGDTSGTVRVYNTADWSLTTIGLTSMSGPTNDVCYSPDGTLIAIAHKNGTQLSVYDVTGATWVKKTLSVNPTSESRGVSFSPDGALLAVSMLPSPYVRIYRTSDWGVETLTGDSFTQTAYRLRFSSTDFARYIGNATVPILDADGNPLATSVRAYARSTGALIASTTSDASGLYSLGPVLSDLEFQVVFNAPSAGTLYNDAIHRVIPA